MYSLCYNYNACHNACVIVKLWNYHHLARQRSKYSLILISTGVRWDCVWLQCAQLIISDLKANMVQLSTVCMQYVLTGEWKSRGLVTFCNTRHPVFYNLMAALCVVSSSTFTGTQCHNVCLLLASFILVHYKSKESTPFILIQKYIKNYRLYLT